LVIRMRSFGGEASMALLVIVVLCTAGVPTFVLPSLGVSHGISTPTEQMTSSVGNVGPHVGAGVTSAGVSFGPASVALGIALMMYACRSSREHLCRTAQQASRRELGSVAASAVILAVAQEEGALAAKFPVEGDESIMSQKAHGTTAKPVQEGLRWNVDRRTADRICSFNRRFAEYAGYWRTTSFLQEVSKEGETTFYDSVTGKPLFIAPRGRSFASFEKESNVHGWPSFRDEEVVWENVRCLGDGECVSADGTHLGHNIPDRAGNRYCINLVSVAGRAQA